VLAMSSLYAEPAYIEHMLPHRDDSSRMATIAAFAGERPLETLAAALGTTGPRVRVDSACSSGSDALIVAHQWLETGTVPDVVVVAAAAMLNPVGLALFHNLHALSDSPETTASRPFDARRRGFVMGEGAAALWLSRSSVRDPLGYVCGHGRSMNAEKFTDMPADTAAMEAACRDALGEVDDLAFISAHGTGTPANDPCETRLYKRLFGRRAYDIPISGLKSMTGHCLGASSLIEIVVSLHALRERIAPPTLNLDEPDPECDLDYIPHRPRPLRGDHALATAFAFGGHNSAVLLSRDGPC
ncbi:MAG: beta-ketoacyl synthase N-terminal-like domain-containing protein, partial [Thermoanaerobaculia bacterium]|nr:beta-ketoacyl synthase N-terminal-like domain-containing protein [Thermoanaerobaculia bacterium]